VTRVLVSYAKTRRKGKNLANLGADVRMMTQMLLKNGNGLRCVRPGKFDLGKRPWNALERSPGPG
jgi:hypothetical protein